MKVEIDILNYNGAELLKKCLPSIIEAAKRSCYNCRLFVIDNCSIDESESVVAGQFPEFTFYKARENKVLRSFNEVAENSDADIMFLLNNDIRVDESFIDPIVDIFMKDKGTFMVSPKFYNFDGDEQECIWFLPQFRAGVFRAISADKVGKEDKGKVCFTFQSGMAAFDRKKFLKLDGYDDIYLPGRIEDSDLCFRAWKRRYRCYYQPESVVFHKATVSFNKAFKKKELLTLSHRNIYIFTWKNITAPIFLFEHFLFLIPRFVYAVLTFKIEIIVGFFRAAILLPRILKKRKIVKNFFLIPDKKIFKLFTGNSVSF